MQHSQRETSSFSKHKRFVLVWVLHGRHKSRRGPTMQTITLFSHSQRHTHAPEKVCLFMYMVVTAMYSVVFFIQLKDKHSAHKTRLRNITRWHWTRVGQFRRRRRGKQEAVLSRTTYYFNLCTLTQIIGFQRNSHQAYGRAQLLTKHSTSPD